MNCFNLTDTNSKELDVGLDFFARFDNIYVSSKISTTDQIEELKKIGITEVIDLKMVGESGFNDQECFEAAGIKYYSMPVQNLDDVDLEFLEKFKKIIKENQNKKLVYCMSANRVGAVLSLFFAKICGHPKARALDIALKLGLRKENLINQVKEKLAI